MQMKISVSDGEVVDKYSILCLKMEKIMDLEKKKHILHEMEMIHNDVVPLIEKWPLYYKLLCHVNRQIWDKTNEIKSMDPSSDPVGYSQLASHIFHHNDQRFRLKRVFNTGLGMKEQKSYHEKVFYVGEQEIDLYKLIYLVMEYDHVCGKVAESHFLPPCFITINEGDKVVGDTHNGYDQETLDIIYHFVRLQI